MSEEQIALQVTDGEYKAYVLTPQGAGPWPAVILYTDAFGIRPGMIEMAQHVADGGYVAVADKVNTYPPEMGERFEAALTGAGVKYTTELYEGKAHGWMKPDLPVHDATAAERGWRKMFALFERNLH